MIHRVMTNASVTNASAIAWCPLCKDAGQTYAPTQTILICQSCDELFCCRHAYGGQTNSVPWHPQHTCEEFDSFKRDSTFRSVAQIRQAKEDELEQQSRELRHQIEIASEQWELSLTAKNDEARLRKIEKARLERERREAGERARLAYEREQAARRVARENEDRASEEMVQKMFVRCPFCSQAVERISGW